MSNLGVLFPSGAGHMFRSLELPSYTVETKTKLALPVLSRPCPPQQQTNKNALTGFHAFVEHLNLPQQLIKEVVHLQHSRLHFLQEQTIISPSATAIQTFIDCLVTQLPEMYKTNRDAEMLPPNYLAKHCSYPVSVHLHNILTLTQYCLDNRRFRCLFFFFNPGISFELYPCVKKKITGFQDAVARTPVSHPFNTKLLPMSSPSDREPVAHI